jgi:hypothetical protein
MLFRVGYTLPYDQSGVILASHKSKIFLAMRGTAAPSIIARTSKISTFDLEGPDHLWMKVKLSVVY